MGGEVCKRETAYPKLRLIISSLTLVPGQSNQLLGGEVLIVSVIVWLMMIRLDRRMLRETEVQYRRAGSVNIALSQLATLPYLVGAIILLTGDANGLYWTVPAVIFSFVKAVLDAWVLLVEINR